MRNIEDYYILGLPIDTDIGEVKFIKVKDYPDLSQPLYMMSWDKNTIIYEYTKQNEDKSLDELIGEISKDQYDLFDIVMNLPELTYSYQTVFTSVLDRDNVLINLDRKDFDYYRHLILRMNAIKEKKVNPNPEIQKWIEKSERSKQEQNGIVTFADIASSIVGYNGLSYQDLNEMTLYQFYTTFHRIGQIKGYDATTLFATVSSEVKMESWYKHIDLFEEENHGMSRKEFMAKTNFND